MRERGGTHYEGGRGTHFIPTEEERWTHYEGDRGTHFVPTEEERGTHYEGMYDVCNLST